MSKGGEGESREGLSLYAHVPFCRSKCHYCGFYSLCDRLSEQDPFLRAMQAEAVVLREDLEKAATLPSIETVYVGGGTPSLLGAERLGRLLAVLAGIAPWTPDCEVTTEVNPEDVDGAFVESSLQHGVTRISVGVQSFHDGELTFLGRRATADRVRLALTELREFGCQNISIDLIYGLPGQSLERWIANVEETLRFGPDHISCYLLTPEVNTVLEDLLRGGYAESPLEETLLLQYQRTRELLLGAGYEQYEISNFARPGKRARHNVATWGRKPYQGLGPAAHSFDGEVRWRNSADLDEYLTCLLERGRRPVEERLRLTKLDAAKEMIYLGLRLAEGITWDALEAALGQPLPDRFKQRVRFLTNSGFLEADREGLKLSPEAYFVSNSVFVEVIRALEEGIS